MNRAFFQRSSYYLVVLMAALLPVGIGVPVAVAMLGLSWLLEGNFRGRFSSINRSLLLLLPTAYYLLHVAGMLHTENTSAGLFDLEVKLSLLLLPLFLSTMRLSSDQVSTVLRSFITGCLAISVCLLSLAVYDYAASAENHFFYELFSRWTHPSYLAMYLNLAIAVLLLRALKGVQVALNTAMALLFSGVIFLLSSKMGLLITAALYAGALLNLVVAKKKWFLGLSGLVLMILAVVLTLKFVPEVGARLEAAKQALLNGADPSNPESSAVRLSVWEAATEASMDNFATGAGTGDVKQTLLAKYKEKGMTGAYRVDEATGEVTTVLNAHNQFLQSFVALGIGGLLLLLATLLVPLWYGWKKRNLLLMTFTLIVVLNLLTESMLEREAGTMFVGFFLALLAFQPSDPANDE